MQKILELLSDSQPMSGPEILTHFPRLEHKTVEQNLKQMMDNGQVVHARQQDQGVTIGTFRLPAGFHRQRTIFDLA